MNPSLTPVALPSPSLGSLGQAGPAYEIKFLLDEQQAQEVEAWARRRLAPDPHGDPALDGAYRTTTLYFDTPERDVYHRSPRYRRSKFRVRRYGAAPWTFLERKSRWGDRVAKQRTQVRAEEVALLGNPLPVATWPGHWFHSRLLERRLRPACHIVYQRTAWAGSSADGALRLTLDRHVSGTLTDASHLEAAEGGLPLLAEQVILELKFHAALPMAFKEVVQSMRLSPRAVSKYRRCRQAWGQGDA